MKKLFPLLLTSCAVLLFGLFFASARAVDKPEFLVDADWLAERMDDPTLVLLEVRYHPHRYFTVDQPYHPLLP